MKKTIILLAIIPLFHLTSQSQDYTKSGISIALNSGVGNRILKQVNDGNYAKSPYNFKMSSMYWGFSFESKFKLHGFGIEWEKQKFKSTRDIPNGIAVNKLNEKVTDELKFTYANLYYKFYIPFEYKKINPYLKGSLIIPVYTHTYTHNWVDDIGRPTTTSGSSVSLGGSFAFHVGANYSINKVISGFTELGVGPIVWKLGIRASYLPK